MQGVAPREDARRQVRPAQDAGGAVAVGDVQRRRLWAAGEEPGADAPLEVGVAGHDRLL